MWGLENEVTKVEMNGGGHGLPKMNVSLAKFANGVTISQVKSVGRAGLRRGLGSTEPVEAAKRRRCYLVYFICYIATKQYLADFSVKSGGFESARRRGVVRIALSSPDGERLATG
jgi:hypothetical protein